MQCSLVTLYLVLKDFKTKVPLRPPFADNALVALAAHLLEDFAFANFTRSIHHQPTIVFVAQFLSDKFGVHFAPLFRFGWYLLDSFLQLCVLQVIDGLLVASG